MDLEVLGLKKKEIELLKSIGIKTVEMLALVEPNELMFTRQKSEYIIQHARDTITYNYTEKIAVDENSIKVTLKKLDHSIEKSVKHSLNFSDGCSNCEVKGNEIISQPRHGFHSVWKNRVHLQALKWKERIDKKEENEIEEAGITIDIEELKEFARKNGFDGFWRTIFWSIKGNEKMKKALAVAMFSDFDDPIHVAIIGPPGSVKSFSMEIISQNFSDVMSIGGNVTRAGLIMNYATGEKGILAVADRKLVLADEFDKVQAKDLQYVYELLSNGKCEVHTGNIHETIKSKFTMIAFMNPIEQIFSSPDPKSDIGLEPALMSRFGLVVKTEELGDYDRLELAREKFYHGRYIERYPEYYDQWIKLARFHEPKIVASDDRVDEYLKDVDSIIKEFMNTPLRRDLRMQDYQRAIPFSIARCEFRDVDEEILDESYDIIEKTIEDWRVR